MGGPLPGHPVESLPLWEIFGICIPFVILFVFWMRKDLKRLSKFEVFLFVFAFGVIIAGQIAHSHISDLDAKIARLVTRILGLHLTQFHAAAFVVFVGWGAYRFKRRSQLLYGT